MIKYVEKMIKQKIIVNKSENSSTQLQTNMNSIQAEEFKIIKWLFKISKDKTKN